jgi:predicted phosphate transport protein (TIGR00153 family)
MECKEAAGPCSGKAGACARIASILSRLSPFPKRRDFFGYFKRSADNIVTGAATLRQMISNEAQRESLLRILDDQEHIGDSITHEVIELLHRTFLTPIDREDIHRLVNTLDDVMDSIHATGNRLSLYRLKRVPAEVTKLGDTLLRSTEEMSRMIAALANLKDAKAIQARCIEIARLENEADETFNEVLRDLYHNDYPPQEIIQVKELIENLERTTDCCKDVAVIVQGIVLKHS